MDSIQKSGTMKVKQNEIDEDELKRRVLKSELDPKFVYIMDHPNFPMELQLQILSYLRVAEFHISPMIEDLIFIWMKWELYKIESHYRHSRIGVGIPRKEFLGILEKHQQKLNGREIESESECQSHSREWYETPFYTHDLWNGRCRGWLNRALPKMNEDERLQSFCRSYLDELNSFQLLDSIFPKFEMELYLNTIQLVEVESESRDGFKIKYKIRGKNYSGMYRITINQLDIYATIVGVATKILNENKFQVRMNNDSYDVSIEWTKVITGTREVYCYGWERAPHIDPKDV